MKTQSNVSHRYEVVPRLPGTCHLNVSSANFTATAISTDGYAADETSSANYVQGLECDGEFGKSEEPPLTPLQRACSCCFNLSWKSNLVLFIFISATVVMLLFVAAPGVCPHIPHVVKPLSDPTSKGVVADATKKNKNFNILFYGDSMLSAPIERYSNCALLYHYYFTGALLVYSISICIQHLIINFASPATPVSYKNFPIPVEVFICHYNCSRASRQQV
jgi:hypothetical protein